MIKAGSQNDAKPWIASDTLYCKYDVLPSALSDATQRNARIGCDCICASAALHLKNIFRILSHHNVRLKCEPSLRATLRCTKSILKLITDIQQ